MFEGEPILAQFYQYASLTEEYTKNLISCLKNNGYLSVFERVGHDPLMCGWMMELCFSECAPIIDTYTEVKCEEVDNINTFQAFICRNGEMADIQTIIYWWYEAIEVNPVGRGQLSGWNALSYLNDNAGQLIKGVRILNDDEEQVGRFTAFYDKDDEPLIYFLHAAEGSEVQLYSFSSNIKEDVLKHLQEIIDVNVKSGLHYEEIDPNEELLEGNRSKQSDNHN